MRGKKKYLKYFPLVTGENFSHERKTSDLNFTDELDNERKSFISNKEL